MRLTPEEELTVLTYMNGLQDPSQECFALWKVEPDGDLVFINDGPTTGDFSREKAEAEAQIQRSTLNSDLKSRMIQSLLGFAGQKKVVGVALRNDLLIKELAMAIKTLPKTTTDKSGRKKAIH